MPLQVVLHNRFSTVFALISRMGVTKECIIPDALPDDSDQVLFLKAHQLAKDLAEGTGRNCYVHGVKVIVIISGNVLEE